MAVDIYKENTKNKISVIIPIYNVEMYLKRCLESVVNQTYTNLEIILVNDGSTDHSESICKEYESRYDNVIYYYKKNGGLSEARNYGIMHATGQYIAFVDSDDYIDIRMYQYLLEDIEKYNADIATCGFQEFTDVPIVDEVYTASQVEVLDKREGIKYLLLSDKYCNYAWNKLYRRSLFEDIQYPVDMKMEDLGTTYRLFSKCQKITYRPFKAYYYFQRADSIIHSADKRFYIDKLTLSISRFRFIREIYPGMNENYLFILRTIFLDFKYFSEEIENVNKVCSLLNNEVPLERIKGLTTAQKIKFFLLRYMPHFYLRLFGVL